MTRPPATRPPVARPTTPAADDWRLDPTLAGTIALAALTLSVALGFGRLFVGRGFLLPVLSATIVAHGVAWWCRRRDLSTPTAAVATLGATGLVAAWTILGHTTAYGIPLPTTIRAAGAALSEARGVFAVVQAPSVVLPGFLLATVLALGLAAFMSDWAAFRLQATFEAVIPAFTLFIFTAALDTARSGIWAVALFVAGTLTYLVVQGLAKTNRAGAWFGGRPARGPGTLIRTAAALGAVGLALGLLVGPRLPAPDEPLVKYKNRTRAGPSNRATISPLVDIRGRLVEQADLEVFTVRSEVKAYWRLTSLDDFDGNTWTSTDTYRETRGGVGTDEILQPGIPTAEAVQEFSISALASIWLPVAYRPERIDDLDGVSSNRDSASVITPEETTDGLTYTARSSVPQLTPELLATAPPQAPAEIAQRYLALPVISPRVQNEARRIVAGATTPYAKARALQDYFHTGRFTYDLNARPGHDNRALENFLLGTRRGYCEQFAGSYAVLARSVGLPTRVAVGFTPGELVDGVYRVSDRNAHAWPEVYLHGFGWVAFEPTPGRGAPNATAYTGRPEDQEDAPGAEGGATTTAPPVPAEGDLAPTTIPEFSGDDGALPSPTDEGKGLPGIVKVLLAVFGVAALWAAVIPALHARRRRLRRGVGGSGGLVLAEWADTCEVLAAAGVSRRPTETMTEYGARAAGFAGFQPEASRALRRLAADASVAAYADGNVPAELVERSAEHGRIIREAVFDQVSLTSRVTWWLDPRPLVDSR